MTFKKNKNTISVKKICFILLSIVFGLFSLFGILGILVFIVDRDLFGLIFYLIWTLLGIFLFRLFLKYALSSKKKQSSLNIEQSSSSFDHSTQQSYQNNFDDPTIQISLDDSSLIQENLTAPISKFPANNLDFPDTYISFDVETPNKNNDRISQIGLVLIENGTITKDYSTLINPETYFDPINTKITGIDSNSVAKSPNFSQYWERISDLFQDYVVVAHNATFDLTVLSKTLSHYALYQPEIRYVCTYEESINKYPALQKHSLDSLAIHFGITQEFAHDASFDAKVCSEIFEKMKEESFSFYPSSFSHKFTESEDRYDITYKKDSILINIPFNTPEKIQISGNIFVLTGIFSIISKNDIESFLQSNGGIIRNSVSGKTNYLIVGTKIEPAWKHGNYGTKIEKAMEIIDSGKNNLFIVPESDFTSMFKNELM